MSRVNLCEGKYSSMSQTFVKPNPIEVEGDKSAWSIRFPVTEEEARNTEDPNIHCENVEMEGGGQDESVADLVYHSHDRIASKRSSRMKKFGTWLSNFQLHPYCGNALSYILLPAWIWLSLYALVGSDNLPGGTIFVVVILGCVGRILGSGVELFHLPPMMGMLGLGLLIRNVPYINVGKHLNPDWSAPIRQTALAVILTRAGLNLDPDVLLRLKAIILRLAFFPTILEATGVAIAANLILDFPWAWGFLLGFVLAPVSPAVVVPRLLELRQEGYGVEKGIPTIVIAAASLDNIVAISLFGVTLGFALSSSSLTYSILQGPLQIVIGLAFGIIWGGFLGIAFSPVERDNNDGLLVRAILTLGGGLISVIGFSKLGFSGGGALGCLLSSFVASCLWKFRGATNTPDPLIWIFAKFWFVFEPLLFGVIGSQIDILALSLRTVYLGIACVCIGSAIRFAISYLMVTKANLSTKEKFFAALCWVPKATVQAAIGPLALEIARKEGKGIQAEELGQTVLTLAVLVILLTAPIGELGVMMTGRKFLTKMSLPPLSNL